MASITSLGIGSGIDINSMVNQLVALERRPLEQMRTEARRLETQVSSLGKMQSLMAALQDAANALTGNSLWTRSTATSSDEASVSPVGGSSAAPGNYAVSVGALAAPQTVASAQVFASATALVGEGTLTIDIGRWDGGAGTFTAKPDTPPVSVSIGAADTLQTLRDKINAAGAGVQASIVTDANGARLALRSSASGTDNGFRVTASDVDGNATDASGLSRIAFDPPGGTTGMLYSQPASNAAATVNGIPIESASNELSGVIEGITLRLRKTTAAPVELAVASDREAVKTAVQAFADAYNELARYIGEQTRYDAASRVGGPLQGDSAVTGLLGRLRGLVGQTSGASASLVRLSDVGLQLQRDGTLKVDSGKLDGALGNLEELKKAFAHNDALDAGNNGFARRFAALATQVLGVDGSLTTRSEGLKKLITANTAKQDRLEDRVERFRERLVAQFTAMDANLSRLQALQSYVSQQLQALQPRSES
jgi:flagellar hook-associated protein 2